MLPTDEEVVAVMLLLLRDLPKRTPPSVDILPPVSANDTSNQGGVAVDHARMRDAAEQRAVQHQQRGRRQPQPLVDVKFGLKHAQMQGSSEPLDKYLRRVFLGTLELEPGYDYHYPITWPDRDVPEVIRQCSQTKTLFYKGDMIELAAELVRHFKDSMRIGIEDFANNQKRGGGVDNGAQAQEEELCRRSTLYRALEYCQTRRGKFEIGHVTGPGNFKYGTAVFSQVHLMRKNRASHYEDEDESLSIDVVATAAPYLKDKRNPFPMDRYKQTMTTLTRNVIKAATSTFCDVLIVGLLGGGAFGGNTVQIAQATLDAIQCENGAIGYVIFAVMNDDNNRTAVQQSSPIMSRVDELTDFKTQITPVQGKPSDEKLLHALKYVRFMCSGHTYDTMRTTSYTFQQLVTSKLNDVPFMLSRNDFISCLFPTTKPMDNSKAWLLYPETIQMALRHPEMRKQIDKALQAIWKFFGVEEEETSFFKQLADIDCLKADDGSPFTIMTNQMKFLNTGRVTQILSFLMLINAAERAQHLLAFLSQWDKRITNTGEENRFPSKETDWVPVVYPFVDAQYHVAINDHMMFVLYNGKVLGLDIASLKALANGTKLEDHYFNILLYHFPLSVFAKATFMNKGVLDVLMRNKCYALKMEEALQFGLGAIGFQMRLDDCVLQDDTEMTRWGNYNITTFQYNDNRMWGHVLRVYVFMMWTNRKSQVEHALDITNGLITGKRCNMDEGMWKWIFSKYHETFGSEYKPGGNDRVTARTMKELQDDNPGVSTGSHLPSAEEIEAHGEQVPEPESTGQINFAQLRQALFATP